MITRKDVLDIVEGSLHKSIRRDLRGLIRNFDREFRRTTLPKPNETAAVSAMAHKTASLFYDRVWSGMNPDVPPSIGFRGATDLEEVSLLIASIAKYLNALGENNYSTGLARLQLYGLLSRLHSQKDDQLFELAANRALVESLRAKYDLSVVPVFSSTEDRDRVFTAGNYSVVIATLSNLSVPIETRLTWKHVQEIRRDKEMISRVRRLKHWLDGDMVGKPVTYVQDEISNRLEEYEAALKKHGIETVLGALAATVDSNAVVAGSAAAATVTYGTDWLWGLAAGGAILVSKAAIHVSRALLDLRELRRTAAPEVSFLAEIQKVKA